MRQKILLPVLLVPALVLLAGASSEAASQPSAADTVGFVPSVATPAQLQAAQPLGDHLAGLSKLEPSLCTDALEPKRETDPNSAGAGSITVSPASTEMADVTPSTDYSYCLVAHNRGSETRDFALSTLDITGSPDPDQQQQAIDPPKALGAWVHPALTHFTLQPGERIFIPYVISMPASLPSGTLTGGIRITQLPPKEAGQSGAVIQPGVIERLHLTLPGGEVRKLDVSDVDAPRFLSHDDDPLAYHAKFVVANKGTVLDAYKVKLDVKGFGRRVGGGSVPTATVLPGGANRGKVDWRGIPWIGLFHPVAHVRSRAGTVDVQLPWLLVLPSKPWLIAIALAILLPIIFGVRRWRRSRAEWMAYLDEDDEYADDGDDLHDDWA